MAETYRDHPLAFLGCRPSAEALAARADAWPLPPSTEDGADMRGILRTAASELARIHGAVSAVADLSAGCNHSDGLAAAIRALEPPSATVSDRLWAAGQALRVRGGDPHGGSTSVHLEMAADEIRNLSAAAMRLRAMLVSGASALTIRDEAFGAVDRFVAEPNHEGSETRM